MLKRIGLLIDKIFTIIEHLFESRRGKMFMGTILVAGFLISLVVIELNRHGVLTQYWQKRIPLNHFGAIQLAFNLLLTLEVLSLVFNLTHSFANSVGKQFEVLSLILLRDTFKEFAHFSEPLLWEEASKALLNIFSTAVGAVLIFILLGFYYRLQKHTPLTEDPDDRDTFIIAKKLIALTLLVGFFSIGFYNFSINFFSEKNIVSAFDTFYTLLIFSDILIVLLSMRYSYRYAMAFRNSGFAVVTVLIRLALLAPPYIAALISLGSLVFAILIAYAFNTFTPAFFISNKKSLPE